MRRRAVRCADGITSTGERELIDFQFGRYESEAAWESSLHQLHVCGFTAFETLHDLYCDLRGLYWW